ncbi:MAG: helix-turn-helix domain-containing protein [Clostridia bacterium]|nr:helix-turn-helix domain-containing protein [Clostridia bacterium]
MDTIKNILAIRIKTMRLDLKLTQEELALKLGLKGKSSIANYESGNITPSDEIKLKMCDIFDCSMDYLLGKTDFKTKNDELSDYLITEVKRVIWQTMLIYFDDYLDPCKLTEDETNSLVKILLMATNKNPDLDSMRTEFKTFLSNFDVEKKKKVKDLVKIIIKEVDHLIGGHIMYYNLMKEIEDSNTFPSPNNQLFMCPVYGHIAAGVPNWAEQCIEGRLPLDPGMMNIHNPEECFFLRVSGESMNKVVKNGGYALIRKQEEVENGEIAVVLVNGYDATLKKFTRKNDMVILEPMSNDSSYEIQIYDHNTQIKILGKYIGKFEMN